jgi:hypothetical protein
MELRPLMQSLTTNEQLELARSCNASLGHLKNVSYGYKRCQPELAALLERETRRLFGEHRTVRRWDLIPDRWSVIWPELVYSPGAPTPHAAGQAERISSAHSGAAALN